MSKANESRQNPLGLLLRLLGSDNSCIRRRPGDAEDFQVLLNAGFLTPDGALSSIICDECGEQEPVSVMRLGGRIGIRCRVEGFVERDPESLAAFRLERDGFARALRVAVTGPSGTSPPLKRISDHLWRLGGCRFKDVRWVGFLALRLRGAEDFAEVGKEIAALSGSPPVAVFTAGGDVENWPSLPKGGRFIPLPEVFVLSPKGFLEADEAALRDGLGLSIPQPRSSGRPSLENEILALIGALSQRENWPSSKNARTAVIAAAYGARHPDKKPPSRNTIHKYLDQEVSPTQSAA